MIPVILEYIWLDGKNNLRSKYKTVNVEDINKIDFPKWNYDGSSTNQASTENSEIILNPIAAYKNPFIRDVCSFLVLCDTFNENDGEIVPTSNNKRIDAFKIFNKNLSLKPWYGIEQEYFIMSPNETHNSMTPLLFANSKTIPKAQGDYYCGVGNQHIIMREMVEKHYKYCIYAGLTISGVNAEVAPSQWEYQIGPVEGVAAGDQLYISRYILHRLSEEYKVNISFDPKPIPSPWNGSGLHTNFSTTETRCPDGLEKINEYIDKLSKVHAQHLTVYGDNSSRLSGECETSSMDSFTCGYGNRGCSIRIPSGVLKEKCGYFEDRRPASDANPYEVISILFNTCCLN